MFLLFLSFSNCVICRLLFMSWLLDNLSESVDQSRNTQCEGSFIPPLIFHSVEVVSNPRQLEWARAAERGKCEVGLDAGVDMLALVHWLLGSSGFTCWLDHFPLNSLPTARLGEAFYNHIFQQNLGPHSPRWLPGPCGTRIQTHLIDYLWG